ncbi:relaxase/mobilization nuclease domain-containing protein [Dysgonomonas sp. OttesenSCG-928-M03]|nr:relaxase/mobilization nuclease domain-containing protein [Dysgonomonas sp. OttesenSCG-928-M03]
MIAKNIKGKSFKGCVNYVMHDTATLLDAEGVWAETKQDIIRSFAMQRSGRKEIKQPVGHIPISFSPEDSHRLTNNFMIKLAKEYMQEMGISNTQYIIVRHDNTENPHLHIVYNRINNDLKLISVNNDYKRNIKVCKKLKDKYNLTYGKGKEKVKREKLDNPDKVKYYIHDAIKSVLPSCKNPADLRFALEKHGIEIDYKHKRTTNEIEGVSFRYNNISFKGSQIDRKYSFGNLKKEFENNIEEAKQHGQEAELKVKQEAEEKARKEAEAKAQIAKRNIVLRGVELTPEQGETLMGSGSVFLEALNKSDGSGKFSAYVFLNDEKNRVIFSKNNPDEFVKFGKYEMRIRDKILIENGYVTKAKIKWYGIGTFAYPYLWKENKSDMEYKESWDDPRLPKPQKVEKKPDMPTIIQKKSRGRGM